MPIRCKYENRAHRLVTTNAVKNISLETFNVRSNELLYCCNKLSHSLLPLVHWTGVRCCNVGRLGDSYNGLVAVSHFVIGVSEFLTLVRAAWVIACLLL